MLRKCLVFCALWSGCMSSVNSMMHCDYRMLNRSVEGYAIAVNEKKNLNLTSESVRSSIHFFSDNAVEDKGFDELLDSQGFQDLCCRRATFPGLEQFIEICENIFKTSKSKLERAGVYLLLKNVVMMLEVMQNSSMGFTPITYG